MDQISQQRLCFNIIRIYYKPVSRTSRFCLLFVIVICTPAFIRNSSQVHKKNSFALEINACVFIQTTDEVIMALPFITYMLDLPSNKQLAKYICTMYILCTYKLFWCIQKKLLQASLPFQCKNRILLGMETERKTRTFLSVTNMQMGNSL